MSFFSKFLINRLLVGQQKEEDKGWVAVVLPIGKKAPDDTLSINEALTDTELNASFVFSAIQPTVESEADALSLVNNVIDTLSKRGTLRGIVWLNNEYTSSKDTGSLLSIGIDNTTKYVYVNYALSRNIGLGITFTLDNGMLISLEEETLCFKTDSNSDSHISFKGFASPPEKVNVGKIAFSGPERGCIAFDIDIAFDFLKNSWFWGFQFQVPNGTEDDMDSYLSEWAPFADIELDGDDSEKIGFSCVFDPGDVFNEKLPRRTLFKFKGSSKELNENKQINFTSYYRTSTGACISLTPISSEQAKSTDLIAGFAFAKGKNLGKDNLNTYVTPIGDFKISAPTASSCDWVKILCGLLGSEFITVLPASDNYEGDRFRFIGSQPSFGYCYPLPQASPVGPPVDPTQKLLDNTFTTSYATVVSAPGTTQKPVYVAQPKGAPLFGQDPVIYKRYNNLLGSMYPGTELDENNHFPMMPYAGVSSGNGQFTFDESLISLFEKQFISPTRSVKIGSKGKSVPSALDHKPIFGANNTDYNITTPSGQLVTIDRTGKWTRILLAQLTHPVKSQFYFQNPSPELKQAFQTADPMLVIANPQYLGTMGNDDSAKFNNTLNVENWVLAAQVGENYSYGNYTNVMIVKGVKGKLYNPKDISDSLAANPTKWTQKENFGAPNGKVDELIPLSQWMLDYFKDAHEKAGSETSPDRLYFEKFNSIVQDENWTGIIILRVKIASLPDQMKGITAGIEDPSQFYAHHLAIETGQIIHDDDGVRLKDSTSVYGLIYYCDPSYDASKPEAPVPPDAGSIYDFRLLTLKVLFENSALKHFQSYAQLTLNQLFGSQVKEMGDGGNMYNSIILRGTFQENDGAPVYGLGSLQDYTFFMDSNVFNKIEITSAQMTTRRATKDISNIWFGMTGYLDFVTLTSGDDQNSVALPIDLFSFGSDDGKTNRQGLHFSNLGLQMDYPTPKPMNRTFVFDTDEIRFDISSSNIRKNSLYRSFALELDGLVHGEGKDNVPSKKGYLNMITDLRLSGVGEKNWNGLKFRLNMGTPGELAGKVGLNADLLLAWSPEKSEGSNYKIEAGLHMPGVSNGASMLSLQGILKLSWGPLRLLYAKDPKSETGHRFMLLLTDIALKFLGLLKIPPNGATLFYLFGNPASQGKSSGLGWYAVYKKPVESKTKVRLPE